MSPSGAAGLGSQCQASGGLSITSLRAADNHKRLTLRGPGSPYARPLHFASPAADGSKVRIGPGASCGVPRSPRTSRIGSPRNSPRSSPRGNSPRNSAGGSVVSVGAVSLRGQPAGKVVEIVRNGLAITWPHSRGSTAVAWEEPDDPSERLWQRETGSLQLARMSLGRSATEVTAIPENDVLASRDALVTEGVAPTSADEEPIITVAEVNALADTAAAEAESHATRNAPDELPPSSQEPMYVDNPWRLGLTARSKERGAMRIFPCWMITPHALSAGSRDGMEARGLGRNASIATSSSMATPTIIPPASSATDPPYPRMVPSSTVSVSSTADLPIDSENGEEPFIPSNGDRRPMVSPQQALPLPGASTPVMAIGAAVVREGVALKDDNKQAGHNTLQRSPSGATALPRAFPKAIASQTATSRQPQPRQPKQRPEDQLAKARRSLGNRTASKETTEDGGSNGSASLLALRTRLEKNLRSAEDGVNSDLKQLDQRLAGSRRTSRGGVPGA